MKKWVRAALWVGAGAAWLSKGLLALIWGLVWLPGWPAFLARAPLWLLWLPIADFLWLPLEKKKDTPKRKVATAVTAAVCIAAAIALNALVNFWAAPTVERLHSPNNVNTAVIITGYNRSIGDVYPMRARYFYENKPGNRAVYWNGICTCTWIDDCTLEISAWPELKRGTGYVRW